MSIFSNFMKSPMERVEIDTDSELYEELRKSNKRLWFFAMFLLIITVIAASTAFVIASKFQIQFRVIPVDRMSGATGFAQTVEEYGSPKNKELNHKYYVKRFLTAYRQYNFPLLQKDYDVVKSYASPDVWKAYSKQFDNGDESLDKKFGNKVTITPINISVIPSEYGFATVRYDLETKDDSGAVRVETRNATIRYEFVPNLKMTEAQAMDNPFGFKVIAINETLEDKK
jgi:type IV secretory pathway component VirB8